MPDQPPQDESPATVVTPAPATPGVATPSTPAAKPPRKRRRWPYVLLGLFVALLLLVAMAPMIASTKPVRSLILSQVNGSLNGRVAVEDWSISWTGGITARKVQVFDEQNAQIAQVDTVRTQLSLLDAVRGKLAIGDTIADGGDFTLVITPDGSVNFAKLAKPRNKPDEPASDLPLLSGKITLKNFRGTVVKQGGPGEPTRTVMLSAIAGEVTIPDINAPIASTLTASASVDNGPATTVSLAGTTSVIRNRRVDLSAAAADHTLMLHVPDAKVAAAFVPPAVATGLAGALDTVVKLRIVDGKSVVVEAKADGTNLAFGVPAPAPADGEPQAAPEVYATNVLSLVVPPTTVLLPQGLANYNVGHLRIGDAAGATIAFKTDHANLTLSGDAPIAALMALADNKQPGAAGTLAQTLEVNVGQLAAMLPRTLGLRPGVRVTGGTFRQSFNLALAADSAAPTVTVALRDVAGTADVANADGTTSARAIAIDPVSVDVAFVSYGGGWTVPDLRRIRAALTSGFGGGEVKAERLESINGSFSFDLAKLAAQAGQFTTALDKMALAGTLTVAAKTIADPAKPAEPGAVEATASVAGFKYGPPGGAKSIDQPLMSVRLSAGLVRDAAGELQKVKDVLLSVAVGPDAARTVDVEIAAAEVTATTGADKKNHVNVPNFTIRKGAIDLGRGKGAVAGVLPSIADTAVVGTATLSGGGSYVNDAATIALQLAVADLSATRSLVGVKMELLKNYSLTLNLQADYTPDAAGNAVAHVSTLAIADDQNLVSLSTKGGPLVINVPKLGLPAMTGALQFGADLGKAKDVYKKFMATPVAVLAYYAGPGLANPRFRKGRVDGTVTLGVAPDGFTLAAIDADVTGVDITSHGLAILTDEKAKLTARAAVAGNFSAARLELVELTSGLATVSGSAKDIRLTTGNGKDAVAVPLLGMVRAATFTVATPDVARLLAVWDVLGKWQGESPAAGPTAAAPTAAAAKPTTAPAVPPAKLAGGSATIKVDVAGDGTKLTVTQTADARQLTVGVGDARYPVGDVAVSMAATITAAPPAKGPAAATQPSVLDQVAEVRVVKLDATGLGTTIALAEPFVVTNPAGLMDLIPSTQQSTRPVSARPAAVAGTLTVSGQLEPLLKLQAVLGGKPATAAYAGGFAINQRLVTESGKIKLVGGAAVDDFLARDAAGKTTYSEKRVTLADDVVLDMAGKMAIDLKTLTFVTEVSKAVALEVTGRVSDLTGRRAFEGTRAKLTYDAEPLWQIVKPMLTDPGTPPEKDRFKDWVVKGKGTREWTVGGAFPAADDAGNPVPFNVAVRSLTANGSIGIDVIKGSGMTIGEVRPVELPLSLKDGVLTVADLTKPAGQQLPEPYACNTGTASIGGLAVNLTGAFPTFSSPPNHPLLAKVQSNAALADFIGDYINNPALLKPDSTNGLLDVTIVECRDVPLGAIAKQHVPENKGYAVIKYSFGGIQLGKATWSGLLDLLPLGDKRINLSSLQGSVKDGTVTYHSGFVGHDMTLALAEQGKTIHVYGDVRLADGTMMPLTMLLSPEWVGGQVARVLPKGLPVSLTGHFSAPQYDAKAAFQEAVKQNWAIGKPQDIAGIAEQLFNRGGKAAAPPPGTNPATAPAARPADPVGDLIGGLPDLFGKDKEKKEREKKEKEKRDKEKRDKDN